jgi:hypothetical protein
MTSWTSEALARIETADELGVSSYRPDGTLRPFVTIWVVRVGDEVYIRSAYGPGNGWFRRAQTTGTGRISVAGTEQDVTFAAPASDVHAAIDAAYHAKYDRYGPAIVGTVVGPEVVAVTLRLDPTA